ncbi:FtsK/SpoIIIE family DNA translocase [Litchfieldia alkalitelluris]|uniref:FtsK/SpoIIIE family DNA translocase n=1 Tax=Litchfieldia alkalitelluris TaxID=304268 RepID=UPI00099738EE|nr:DNA translocase FtsK [Litchfieldia alkalitelluris]
MSKQKKKHKKRKEEWKQTLKFELIGLSLLAITCIGLSKLGTAGAVLVNFFRFFIGEWSILGLIGLLFISGFLIWKRSWPTLLNRKLFGIYLITSSILLLSHVTLFRLLSNDGTFVQPSVILKTWQLFWDQQAGLTSTNDLGGGMIGAILFAASYFLFDESGTKIISIFLIVIGVILVTGKSLSETLIKVVNPVASYFKDQWKSFIEDAKEWFSQFSKQQKSRKDKKRAKDKKDKKTKDNNTVNESTLSNNEEVVELPLEEVEVSTPIISNFADRAYESEEKKKSQDEIHNDETSEKILPITFTGVENFDYELPPLTLLSPPKQNNQSTEHENIYENARKLERTFQSFGVKAKVTKVHLGPAVTKYEVYPDVGVKVSKIVNLSDDLALALAAKDIRIEAPIPGKSAIGIEVPNMEVAMVSLREVIDVKENSRPDAKLLIGLGRDISGEAVSAELNKMPHLLVAGATGSGKSVCINGIIISILMRAKPHEVKMMMIDPKMVELNMYNGIPHLLAPVVTDPKKASQALKKVVNEMERRYELFSHSGTRNIEGYNDYIKRHNEEEEAKQPTLPYIVVIVDELADLMMVASSDVEDSITRLAQMARAAGIHLIIATQRPSVDVITGVIKANIPSRIAFSVSSQTDSRTILDMGGAEKLLGRGDMLFLPVGASKPVRVQGAFLSDHEVEEIVDFVIAQQKAQYQEEMIPQDVSEPVEEIEDDLYDEAVQLIIEMQTASVSMLQRRFRIGYTRAARLIDAMEVRGIVGPYEGSKPRTVLVSGQSEDVGS